VLSRIPLIGGWLFGNTKQTTTTSELFLFLTPHIISDDTDIDKLRNAVKDGSELLQEMPLDPRLKVESSVKVPAPVPVPARPDTAARPVARPLLRTPVRPDTLRPPVRPDTSSRLPAPSIAGDSALKVLIPIKRL
jgi:hypothetical protein